MIFVDSEKKTGFSNDACVSTEGREFIFYKMQPLKKYPNVLFTLLAPELHCTQT